MEKTYDVGKKPKARCLRCSTTVESKSLYDWQCCPCYHAYLEYAHEMRHLQFDSIEKWQKEISKNPKGVCVSGSGIFANVQGDEGEYVYLKGDDDE